MTIIQTDQLILRHLTTDDDDFILELLNTPSFIQNVGDKEVRTTEDARKYLLDGPISSYEQFGLGLYLVVLRSQDRPIGICGLIRRPHLSDVDSGFALLPRFWGNGYACEAATATLEYGQKTAGLGRIVAFTLPENKGSIRVLEKIGLKYEDRITLSDDDAELCLYAIEFAPSDNKHGDGV